MQLDKRGKIQEGSCFHCSHSYPNLLVVSVIKIGLYIFTCGLYLWFHMQSLKLGASFWNLESWVSNLFSSAEKITFVAVKLAPGGHLLFLLCSSQTAGHESA